MPLIRAWANGLRTMDTHSIPGTLMSLTYRDFPVISSGSSLRCLALTDLGCGLFGGRHVAPYAFATAETAFTMLW